VLGESIPITGTPYSLNYRSHRVLGRIAERTLNIPLSEDTLPASLEEIILEIEIAGRKFKQTYPPQTNLTHTFTWDGKDTYGRTLQGGQPVTVSTMAAGRIS